MFKKLQGFKKWGKKKRSKEHGFSDVNIQIEGDATSFGSSSGPTSIPPSSPNTSLQVTPSRGSDQKPETSSQASGSFLQNADNVRVTGGQFNSTFGHHVTINVTRPEGSSVEGASRVTVASSPHNSSPNDSVGQSHSPEGAGGISISIEDSQKSKVAVFDGARRGNEIYERHLSLKGRGFPLWIPEPNNRLPLAYRRKGINIGDVGIITPSGGFSYLFNICVPRGDPLNPRALPEDFAPLSPPLDPIDIREFSEFKPGSHLASASIENSQRKMDSPELVFETSASEGAVLTMPKGAIALDLENVPLFREYVAANVAKWYRFVNGVRGREAKNGDVRVVIGYDKTTSWGMAAISNVTQQKASQLKFKILEEHRAKLSGTAYTWEYSGMAEVRVGPDAKEITALRNGDAEPFDVNPPSDDEFSNQCLFVRTLNATLSDKAWKELNDSLASPSVLDSGPSSRTTFLQTPTRPQGSTFSTTTNAQQMTPDTPSVGRQRSPHPLHRIDSDHDEKELIFSTTPDNVAQHPSDGLNKLLLNKFPDVRMVVTLDADWSSVIEEGEEDLPNAQQIYRRLISSHDIMTEEGVLFLERKIQELDRTESRSEAEQTDNVDSPDTTDQLKPPAPSPSAATQKKLLTQRQEMRTPCSNCRIMKFNCLPIEGEKRCQQCGDRNLECKRTGPPRSTSGVSPKHFQKDLVKPDPEGAPRSDSSHVVVSKHVHVGGSLLGLTLGKKRDDEVLPLRSAQDSES